MSDASVPTQSEAVEALRLAFPAGFGGRGDRGHATRVPPEELVINVGPLTAEHVAVAEAHMTSATSLAPAINLQTIRHSHHRAAQFVALGLDNVTVARLSNYSPSRIASLRDSPAFVELVDHYAGEVKAEWADFVSASKDLSMDVLALIRERVEDNPDALTMPAMIELLKTLADRTGNAPVQRSVSVNANVDLGSDLRKARERAFAAQRQALLDPPS